MALILTPGQLNHKAELYHQLGQLLTSGIGLIQSLEIQIRNPPSRAFQQPLAKILHDLQQRRTFGEAVHRRTEWIPPFDASLLEAGEKSGRLPATFALLADHYHDRARLMRQLIGLCAYPVLLLHMAVMIFPITALQDLVLKAQIFAFFQQKLTILLPLYAGAFALVYLTQGTRGEQVQATLERCSRMIPLLGQARHCLALARLSAALEALITAGVSIIEAWEQAAQSCGSPALLRAVRRLKPRMEQGQPPSEVLRASLEFPDLFRNQYHSGEISGRLDSTLAWLHRHYAEEASRRLKTSVIAFGSILFLAVVGVVVWQIFAFYLNYFRQITDVIE